MEDPTTDAWKTYERALSEGIVDSVNFLRGGADLTIKELAERLNHFGWPIGVPTLSGILSGRKRGSFTVGEIFVLARALNVSPLYLILGLPKHGELPEGSIMEGRDREVARALAWMADGYTLPPYPGDVLERRADSRAYFVEAIARQGIDDLKGIVHAERIIRWQAALLVAASERDKEEIEGILPEQVIAQDYLWAGINELSSRRRAQQSLGDGYGIPISPVIGWLSFIEVDPPIEVADPTIEELRTLTDEVSLSRARDWIQDGIERAKEIAANPSAGGLDGLANG